MNINPATLRRTLLLAGVCLAALQLPKAQATAQPFASVQGPVLLDVTCPPSDGYDWHRSNREPAYYTFWIVPSDGRAVIGNYSAMTYFVGHVALIYSWESLQMASEGKRQHEFCHALGWDHGEVPIGGALWK